ncbi:hypothetical protein ARMGADRAFT_1105081 [Armillaria gallica]|uniref:Uncharacterized protein n=1 Tax=Armillaria gallica TaxID=47427 RepID=A0A2H3DEQ8_ARMGA|nr:hypothetical protein ARMGADRAFT_1105081 [Armillaria gallica]
MLKATSFESILYATHAALVIGTVWRVVVRDKGRICFIQCGLVIVMYLIATSPLALRWKFIRGITNNKTQETTYIYSHGWIILSSMSFMAVILVMGCIMIWWCWFFAGQRLMFAIIPGLCITVRTSSALYHYHQKFELTSNLVFASVDLYQMSVTPPSGNACVVQLDWMLPYFSMVLAVTLSCALVTLYHIVMDRRIGGRTLRLWIKVIVKSSLLFAAVPVVYIMSDTNTGCPLLVVTMIMVLLHWQFVLRNTTEVKGRGPTCKVKVSKTLVFKHKPYIPPRNSPRKSQTHRITHQSVIHRSTVLVTPRQRIKLWSIREGVYNMSIATTHTQTTASIPAPLTCTREAPLNAEVEAVDAAEEVEGVVDDTWVEDPDAEAEAELAQVLDPYTEAEPDPDVDLETRLTNEG